VSTLEVENLCVSFGAGSATVHALREFSIKVSEGRFAVLLGESGCGKTTVLNSVAGLLRPTSGSISLGGRALFREEAGRERVLVQPDKRDIGMVFQSFALWPHMSVAENVMYPLSRRGQKRQAAREAADRLLAAVRCTHLSERLPGELSGGQQQRVALARALVAKPQMILFDEPLSSLDANLRRNLRDELSRLHREIGFTAVYVTHDQEEALSLGTDIAVMSNGRIIQFDSPEVVYRRPATEYVAKFFGANILTGRIVRRSGSLAYAETLFGGIEIQEAPDTSDVRLSVMPQAIDIRKNVNGAFQISNLMFVGAHREVVVVSGGCEILVLLPVGGEQISVGDKIDLIVLPENVRAFPCASN